MREPTILGTVMEALGCGRFKVRLDDDREIIAYVGGKMKVRNIQVSVLDRVEVILDPAGGKATNRIVWRK